MSLMDPNSDPMLQFSAFQELAKLLNELKRSHSREPRRKKTSFKQLLLVAIRRLGRWLAYVGYRLERVGYDQTRLKY
jgi:hypothetical protein